MTLLSLRVQKFCELRRNDAGWLITTACMHPRGRGCIAPSMRQRRRGDMMSRRWRRRGWRRYGRLSAWCTMSSHIRERHSRLSYCEKCGGKMTPAGTHGGMYAQVHSCVCPCIYVYLSKECLYQPSALNSDPFLMEIISLWLIKFLLEMVYWWFSYEKNIFFRAKN